MDRDTRKREASEDDPSALVVILDANPFSWGIREENTGSGELIKIDAFLDHLLVFINAFFMLHHRNNLTVIGCTHTKSELLFPSNSFEEGLAVSFAEAKPILCDGIKSLVADIPDATMRDNGSLFAGALSTALCSVASMLFPSLNLASPSDVNRVVKLDRFLQPRILVITVSPDTPSQYVPFMNAIFSAQKLDIVLDACVLSETDSTFLQQACHLTGGTYLKPAHQTGLVQYLLSTYLLDGCSKKCFLTPQQKTVDYRAACFCHKTVIKDGLGYVCSVCLSIFCELHSVCTTCGADAGFYPCMMTLSR